jgi:hypothetical protein
LRPLFALKATPSCDIQLTPDYRLNPHLFCSGIKLKRSVQITVIGHRNRWLPKISRPLQNFRNLVCTIKEAVLSVKMKMNKRIGHK